jgi:peptidoglycan-associated lipoprotein
MRQFKTQRLAAFTVLAAVFLGGCSSLSTSNTQADLSSATTSKMLSGKCTRVKTANMGFLGEEFNNWTATNQKYYFPLNKSELNASYLASIDAQARYLHTHKQARVRLEGHTDERGSHHYNVSLGEKRANAVAEALIARGASATQFVILSQQHSTAAQDEMAHRLNRRVDLIYEAK